MSALRSWLERPIADHDQRRAFAAAAIALLLAAGALSVTADPPDRPPTTQNVRRLVTSADRAPTTQPDEGPAVVAEDVPAHVADVARRFIDGYLAHLYKPGRAQGIRGASDRLRRHLLARPVRVSPAMRGQRPHLERLNAQPLPDGWLVKAQVATDRVSFPITVVVADRAGGPVVSRLVED